MSYVTRRGHQCDITVLNVHVPPEDKHDKLGHVFDTFPMYHMKIPL